MDFILAFLLSFVGPFYAPATETATPVVIVEDRPTVDVGTPLLIEAPAAPKRILVRYWETVPQGLPAGTILSISYDPGLWNWDTAVDDCVHSGGWWNPDPNGLDFICEDIDY